MKKLSINPGCTTCGLCEFIAPDVFEVTDISHIKKSAPIDRDTELIKQAVQLCPVAVIHFNEETQ